MLEGLKRLLGKKPSPSGSRPRWEKKPGEKIRWVRKPSVAPLLTADESVCPRCKQPMLREWGTNCPRCKPRMAVARTMAHTAAHLRVDAGLALGWLVVLQSPDSERRGGLIELEEPITVLSRGARPPSPGVRCCAFEDEFMSSSHAAVRRPAKAAPEAAFVIEERREPASANGVFVNSRRIRADGPHELSDGDIVRLGTTELQFKSLWLPPGIAQV